MEGLLSTGPTPSSLITDLISFVSYQTFDSFPQLEPISLSLKQSALSASLCSAVYCRVVQCIVE